MARRPIAYECMFCHNGYPEIPQRHTAISQRIRFTQACRRGSIASGVTARERHVKAAQSPGVSLAEVRGSILNPVRLSKDRLMKEPGRADLRDLSQSARSSVGRLAAWHFIQIAV